MRYVWAALLPLAALAACDPPTRERVPAPGQAAEAPRQPAHVVDSARPMAEELRRFRAGLGPAPAALAGGERSRAALVARFVSALVRDDSAELAAMHLDRAEFAYLYFPTSRFASPPYELSPALLWFQMTSESNKGVSRALRLVGRGGTYLGHECASTPERQGENILWTGCRVSWRTAAGDSAGTRLFGSIIERSGRFKFVSYANKL